MKSPRDPSASRFGRRSFLQLLAWSSALPFLGGPVRVMAQSGAGGAPPPAPVPAPTQSPAAEEVSPDVATLTEILRRRYGKFLTPDQLKELAPDLDRMIKNGERLRKAQLKNGDEPDIVFRAAIAK